MPDRATIEEFLAQSHIAVVGVSHDHRQFSNGVYRSLRRPSRRLYPVNRTVQPGERIEGDEAYAALGDVPDPVDGVIVMVSAAEAAQVVHEAATRGIPRVWLHRGVGRGSASEEAVAAARAAHLLVVDGACPLMYDRPVRGIHRLHKAVARGAV